MEGYVLGAIIGAIAGAALCWIYMMFHLPKERDPIFHSPVGKPSCLGCIAYLVVIIIAAAIGAVVGTILLSD